MNETLTKIASYTVTGGGDASVTFTNIPQGYTDLKLVASIRSTKASTTYDAIAISFNGASNVSSVLLQGDGGTATSNTQGGYFGYVTPAASTANVFGNLEIYIPNYSIYNGFNKAYLADVVNENNGGAYICISGGYNASTTPITSITFGSSSGSYVATSSFTLYGIRNMASTLGNSIKATGGNILFDGTYVYHVFNSTSTFVPNTRLLGDVIIVAGGGGGGATNNGGPTAGGGGAGGFQLFQNQTLSSCTVTVGAGGAGSAYNSNAAGTNGGNSAFGSLAVSIGGGGGAYSPTGGGAGYNGVAGGSGGGGGTGGNGGGTGGSGTAGQGYAGGSGNTSNPGGGGGGAGGAGGNATGGVGAGGVGITSSLINSIAAATTTGVLSGGNYYFAGGGGGGSTGTATVGGLGGGANGNSGANVPTAATANTGGGGGGSWANAAGGTGGSGIVIVRYKA